MPVVRPIRITFVDIAIGAAVALLGPAILRAVVVGVVRAGYEARAAAGRTWSTVKRDAGGLRHEAAAARDAVNLRVELERLRAEVAALQAETN